MTRDELLTAACAEENDASSWAIISEDDHGAVYVELGGYSEDGARKILRHYYQEDPSAFVARRVVTFEAAS